MNDNEEDNQSFLSHLEALRTTLLKCFYVLGAVLPLAFYFSPKILNKLIKIVLSGNDIAVNYFSPAEVFILQIKTALVVDLIVCSPFIAKNLWDFILPALYDNEKKFIKSSVFLSVLLFLSGVSFCLFVILPCIINFGLTFQASDIKPMFGISNIVNLSLWLCVIFGLMFQIPVITFWLITNDIFSYESIANKRSYVIVILLIAAGILTPPDVVSQVMLALPTYLLFEAGLFFSKLKFKNKKGLPRD